MNEGDVRRDLKNPLSDFKSKETKSKNVKFGLETD